MIEWRDHGALLSARPHGETSVIAEVFCAAHGRCAGVIRGGISRKLAPVLQPGNVVAVAWAARLEEHLGHFTVEPVRSRAGMVLGNRLALEALQAVTGLLGLVLPEREPHPALYDATQGVLDLLTDADLLPLAYLRWEQKLLEDLGYGLELGTCTVTGVNDDLAFVSPKTGRAVSRSAAGPWEGRLLPLPPVLVGQGDAAGPDIAAALAVTGYFIEHRLMRAQSERPMPAARARFIALLARQS